MEPRTCVVVAAVAVALGGCPSSGAPEVKEPEVADTRVATTGARDLMKEIYGNVRAGSTGGMLPLIVPTLTVVGPGPADLYTDRTAALVALATVVPDGEKHKLVSTDLRVLASPAGHAAWATDVVELDGKRYVIGVIMLEADELWTIAAIQIGTPMTKKQLAAVLAKGPPAAPSPAPAPAAGTDKDLAALFKAGAVSPQALADQIGDSPGAVVRDLSGKSQVGGKAIRKAWKKSMKKVVTAPREPIQATMAPDGTLGWAFGTVDVTTGKDPPVPTRMLHVYEKGDAGWQLMLAFPTVPQAR